MFSDEPSYPRWYKRLRPFRRRLQREHHWSRLPERFAGARALEDEIDRLRTVIDSVAARPPVLCPCAAGFSVARTQATAHPGPPITEAIPKVWPPNSRVLATVLFTDIVGSTVRAAELGDGAWRSLLEHHDTLLREAVRSYRGRLVKSLGDGALAVFDGPSRAIKSATAIRDAVQGLGLEIRAGLHTGECELLPDDDVGGLAVHIGARVSCLARPGEVLVSGTVRDLTVGSGQTLIDRGEHHLTGIPGPWRIFAVGA